MTTKKNAPADPISGQVGEGGETEELVRASTPSIAHGQRDRKPPSDADLWDAALSASGQLVAATLNGITIIKVALRRWNGMWVSHFPEIDVAASSALGREIARAGVAAQMLAGVAPADLELVRDARGKIFVAPVSDRERVLRVETAGKFRPYRNVILAIAATLAVNRRIEGEELAAHLAPILRRKK
jgi:hypothetical protein